MDLPAPVCPTSATEVPGLAARRIAADILDGVLHKRRTLDDQLDGAAAHPGLKTLSDRDRALMLQLGHQLLKERGHADAPFRSRRQRWNWYRFSSNVRSVT